MSVRPSVNFRQHIHGPTWGFAIYRTSYAPALQEAWERTIDKVRNSIIVSIEKELYDWETGALLHDVDPSPVNSVKDRLQLVIHDDAGSYEGLDENGVREAFHAWCYPWGEQVFTVVDILANPDASKVHTRSDIPVSEWVCLMINEEVIRSVDGDLKNEYGEGPYVKAIERLPAMGPEYDGSFKVALTYLWGMYGLADNEGGVDQFLPPKRRKTGERPIYNGAWPEDVMLESAGFDPDEMPSLDYGLGHAYEEPRDSPTESQTGLRTVQVSTQLKALSSVYETAGKSLLPDSLRDPTESDGRLSLLPRETINRIASHLDRTDILNLSLASKGLYTLTKKLLYSTVTLRNNDAMIKFTRTLATRPSISDLVLTYSIEGEVDVEPSAGCIIDYHIERLSSLQTLLFRPAHRIEKECRCVSAVTRKLSGGHISQTLKAVCFDLVSSAPTTAARDAQQQLLLKLLSIPQLETVAAFHRMTESDYLDICKESMVSSILPQDPPVLKETRCTNLRNLVLHSDGLTLTWLGALLSLPRCLERFRLILSLNYRHNKNQWPSAITLDTALEAVTETLEVLDISTPYNSSAPEGVGLYFSSRGLSGFKRLRELYIPESFLNERHGLDVDGSGPWFPDSLVSLGFSNAWPSFYPRSSVEFDRPSVAMPFGDIDKSSEVDAVTRRPLRSIKGILNSLPNFTIINVPPK
ncbi:hypothetical protein BJX63DRAFT_427111 [Aspergillus granulosus]|uniref:F-box domain-containing protein n=1 Tax=Aspergillus granulosus TaxID=176169 RepID=A0ABR4I465_9EURO